MNGNRVVVDRLSLLPDDIICHILSFLLTTKDSVKTSVLSKRYRCLFASVPVIDLDFDLYFSAKRWLGDTERGFTQFMNKTLTSKERINKFRIPYMLAGHNSPVNSWIRIAIMRNVEILDIGYRIHFINFGGNSEDSVFLPNELFQCRTLVSLKLGINYSEILVPKNVDMPNLKELSLRFQNNVRPDFITISLQNLFTGCPVLEDLSIDSYIREDFISGGHVIVISIPSLKRLKLSWIRRMPKTIVDAPNLLQFDSSVEAMIDIEMKIINYLVNDRITISPISSPSEGFSSLIAGTSCVKSLSLNVDPCKVDWFFEHCSLPKFPMLKHLELHGPINDRRESLAVILGSMPKLKCLVIDLDYMRHGRLEEEIEFYVPLNTPACFFQCLKEVEFRNFCGHKNDFEHVQYILQHGKALRRMTIHHSKGRNPEKHGSCSRPIRCACYSRSTKSVRKQLLALTKSSKTCEIVFG